MNMTSKIDDQKRTRRRGEGQDGSVLFIVLLLIIMFTGLGLLAMRHTRQELRSSGAYKDNTQATALAEGALAMMATDLKRSSDYYGALFAQTDYQTFQSDAGASDIEDKYHIPLNPELFEEVSGGFCQNNLDVEGCVHQLSWTADPVNLYAEGTATDPWDDGTGELVGFYRDRAVTTITQHAPLVGPCPPGYSCNDEQNYGWYIFKVEANVTYGGANTLSSAYERGHAVGRGRMTIGPIGVYGK